MLLKNSKPVALVDTFKNNKTVLEDSMKNKERFTLCALGFALFVLFNNAYAQDSDKDKLGPYKLLTTIDVGVLNGFDISWVDSETGRYYLTNRGDATLTPKVGPSIPVIDTRRNKFLYAIPLSNAGNGVVVIHRGDDGDEEEGPGTLVVGTTPNVVVPPTPPETSKVLFIDLAHPFATPFPVNTGGQGRADELAYDPLDHIILVANDRAADLFVTLISTENPPHVLGKIFYNGSTPKNPIACDHLVPPRSCGIEQPVWDKKTRRFYLAIPATVDHPNGEVDEIDPNATPVSPADTRGKITRFV